MQFRVPFTSNNNNNNLAGGDAAYPSVQRAADVQLVEQHCAAPCGECWVRGHTAYRGGGRSLTSLGSLPAPLHMLPGAPGWGRGRARRTGARAQWQMSRTVAFLRLLSSKRTE